jgi:cytochrome c oxidase assembly protein subunit 15
MFFFPISKWVGGIFYEHTHRLVASLVGLMTVILALWLWLAEERRWLRWVGLGAAFTVVLQGVLGGLRVTALKDEIGVFHATLAQLFLALVSAVALVTSRWWTRAASGDVPTAASEALVRVYALATGIILLQLIVGAMMRHQHAGLAIPDFPLAYGKIWPAMDAQSIERYNQLRAEATGLNAITAFGIGLQMTHRITALLVLASVAFAAWRTRKDLGCAHPLARLSLGWLGLIIGQVLLGAATIWTNKSADLTTIHVAVGAVSLVTGSLLLMIAWRFSGSSASQPESGAAGCPREPARAREVLA